MSDDKARRELADLVEDLLARGKQPDMPLVMLLHGMSSIQVVVDLAREQHGSWGDMRRRLIEGVSTIDAALHMEPPVDARWKVFAMWQRGLAATMLDSIDRLQAGETTLV